MTFNLGMEEAYNEATQDTADALANSQPIPAGDYPVIIDNIEYKQFSSGSWGFNIKLSITGTGQYAGRGLYETYILIEADGVSPMLRLDPRSGTMKNFGKIGYAKLCQALNLTTDQANDAENIATHMCGKQLVAKTKIVPKDKKQPDGEKEAKVSYFKPMAQATGAMAPQQAPVQQQQPAQQQTQGGQGFYQPPQGNNGFNQPAQQPQGGNAFNRP